MSNIKIILVGLITLLSVPVFSQSSPYLSALEIGPDIDIFFLQYNRKISAVDELVFGIAYQNSEITRMIAYPGSQQLFSLEAAYRRFIWEGFHVEGLILPQYLSCYENVNGKYTHGFGLVVELRLGYQFNFVSWEVPWYLSLQLFAGYRLINPKPQSFIHVDMGSFSADNGKFYTAPVPMFLFGFRF